MDSTVVYILLLMIWMGLLAMLIFDKLFVSGANRKHPKA